MCLICLDCFVALRVSHRVRHRMSRRPGGDVSFNQAFRPILSTFPTAPVRPSRFCHLASNMLSI